MKQTNQSLGEQEAGTPGQPEALKLNLRFTSDQVPESPELVKGKPEKSAERAANQVGNADEDPGL